MNNKWGDYNYTVDKESYAQKVRSYQGIFLQTWFSFNISMDK